MDGDSVVDLEREVEEFLLTWSSSTPTEDEMVPKDPVVPAAAHQMHTFPRTTVIAGPASSPSQAAMDTEVQRYRGALGVRHSARERHRYRDGRRGLRRPAPLQPFHGSYVAELRATWPARYWKLKGSMDRIWKCPYT